MQLPKVFNLQVLDAEGGEYHAVQPTALARRRQTLQKRMTHSTTRKAMKGIHKKPFKALKPHNLSLNRTKCTHSPKCH